MTVSSSTRKQSFAGGQGTLTFSFKCLPGYPDYIKVLVTTGSTQTALTYDVDYTVSLNADGVGGTVTVSPTYSTAYTYTVYRETSDIQSSDYDDYNQFPADTLEEDLDRRTLISQESDEDSDRALKFQISSTVTASTINVPDPTASTVLGWNSAGTNLQNYALSSAGVTTLQEVFDAGQSITIADTDNQTLTINQNDTTNNPTALCINNTGSGPAITCSDGDIRNVAWTDYGSTSTVTGWSSFTTKTIYYKKVGNLVFVSFNIRGTSNTTTAIFTVPYTISGANVYACAFTTDNGTAQTTGGVIYAPASAATVNIYKDMATNAFTNSGDKFVSGQFWYEANT